MQIPIASTITLIMELIIGCLIFHIVYSGYIKNVFSKKLAFFAVAYEIVFNVGYMLYRTFAHPTVSGLSGAMKLVGAVHGILSLIMLFVVVGFFVRAGKEYGKNINYFAKHKIKTWLFLIFWTISLLSGIFLYVKVYY